MSFQTSSDGTAVTQFRLMSVPTTCGTITATATGTYPINHATAPAFSNGSPTAFGLRFSGSFPSDQRAEGMLSFRLAGVPGCTSADVSWTATTSTPPPAPADSTPPVGVSITGPSTLAKPFQLLEPLALSWTASDSESGISSYQLSYRTAAIGGGFGAPATFATTIATGTTFTLKPGDTYCFRVRATNGKGLTADSPERCTALPLHAYGLSVKGTWKKVVKAEYYLGRCRTAKAKGAALFKTGVPVKRLAIVATRGRGMGTVAVYLGTTKLKTIALAASATRRRQLITVATFAGLRRGTVKIVVTSRGKPVVIEGLAVSKV